jgi:hypothetical protein
MAPRLKTGPKVKPAPKVKTLEKKPKAAEKLSPFAWLDSITQSKTDLMIENGENSYPAFMVNRGLSYYPDTLMHAVELNLYQHLDYRLQYDYYLEAIRKQKRWSKWGKKKTSDDAKIVMDYYKCNSKRAAEMLQLLTAEQIEQIKELLTAGTEN